MTIDFSNNNAYKNMMLMSGTTSPAGKISPQIPAVKVGEVQTEEEKKKNKKKLFGIIGLSVGTTALAALITLSFMSKGSNGIYKKFKNMSDSMQKKIYDLSTDYKNLTTSQKIKLKFSQVMKPAVDSLQSISNFNAIKDSAVYQGCKKLGLNKPVEKINNFFKNIVLTTKRKSYQKAQSATLNFCEHLTAMAKKNGDKELLSYAEKIRKNYDANFHESAHRTRSNQAWDEMKDLHEKVYETLFKNGGIFAKEKRSKIGNTYLTMELVSKDKQALEITLNKAKSVISNNIGDNYSSMKTLLNEIKVNVNPKNQEAVDLIKQLSANMEKYKTANGTTEQTIRKELEGFFKNDMKQLSEMLSKEIKKPEKAKAVEESIQSFCKIADQNVTKKGLAQEAITIIKETYGKNSPEYAAAKKHMETMNNRLNNAISDEMTAYEKLAELRVGSAPTDIVGILWPSALAAGLIASSKDKDERISKTLTQGIPILGGICTSYYGTTRMFTGAKNLALGLITGWILNLAGTKVDEAYKKSKEKQNILKTAMEKLAKFEGKSLATIEQKLSAKQPVQ